MGKRFLTSIEVNGIEISNVGGIATVRHADGTTASILGRSESAAVSSKDLTADTNKYRMTKEIRIASPGSSEDVTIFYVDRAVTITQVRAVLVGSSTPSVTYQIMHNTDRSAAGNTATTSAAVTSETTGTDATLDDATVPAESWVWIETTAQSGTVDEMAVFIEYTED